MWGGGGTLVWNIPILMLHGSDSGTTQNEQGLDKWRNMLINVF